MFKVQYSVYFHAPYRVRHLPRSLMNAMERAAFSLIPSPQDICWDGLMRRRAVLEVKNVWQFIKRLRMDEHSLSSKYAS